MLNQDYSMRLAELCQEESPESGVPRVLEVEQEDSIVEPEYQTIKTTKVESSMHNLSTQNYGTLSLMAKSEYKKRLNVSKRSHNLSRSVAEPEDITVSVKRVSKPPTPIKTPSSYNKTSSNGKSNFKSGIGSGIANLRLSVVNSKSSDKPKEILTSQPVPQTDLLSSFQLDDDEEFLRNEATAH